MSLCLRLFNAKGKFGDQLSYCIGIELSDITYYIKAESARTFNEWVEVSCTCTARDVRYSYYPYDAMIFLIPGPVTMLEMMLAYQLVCY